ncbi:MAG TPA: hypothetical protein VGM03_12990, partial [Phycisphaerae bacterium]
YLTRPVDHDTLVRFYRLVRPAGPGWSGIRRVAGVSASPGSLSQALLGWVLGCLVVYSALFGAGQFIYGNRTAGLVCGAVFTVSSLGLVRLLPALRLEKSL